MSLPRGFWLNWWVNFAIAFGTITAVVVALFGQSFRAKFFPPQLSIVVDSVEGNPVRAQLNHPETAERMEDARYFHVRVSNARRWSPASQVQVYLLRVEEPGPDGNLRVAWRGDGVPLRWQHQEVHPVARTIGASALADLCSVVKDKWLDIHPLITPYALTTRYRSACTLFLTLQARGNEGDSSAMRVRIAWDGRWHDGSQEMRGHLVVDTLSSTL